MKNYLLFYLSILIPLFVSKEVAAQKINFGNHTLTYVSGITSNIDFIGERAIELYPNPTNNVAIIKMNLKSVTESKYKVINSMGIEVARGIIEKNKESIINLSGMENGIYMIRIFIDGDVFEEKLIKQ